MSQGLMRSVRDKLLIAIGSNVSVNIEETRDLVEAALAALAERFPALEVSHIYKTPCFPEGSGPDFINCACRAESIGSPDQILDALHEIENAFGRTRKLRWGKRSLDLDLIACDGQIWPDPATHAIWRNLPLDQQMQIAPGSLILPHPRVQDRSFVLVPLMDVAPDWVHPILKQSVAEMLAQRPKEEVAQIVRL